MDLPRLGICALCGLLCFVWLRNDVDTEDKLATAVQGTPRRLSAGIGGGASIHVQCVTGLYKLAGERLGGGGYKKQCTHRRLAVAREAPSVKIVICKKTPGAFVYPSPTNSFFRPPPLVHRRRAAAKPLKGILHLLFVTHEGIQGG